MYRATNYSPRGTGSTIGPSARPRVRYGTHSTNAATTRPAQNASASSAVVQDAGRKTTKFTFKGKCSHCCKDVGVSSTSSFHIDMLHEKSDVLLCKGCTSNLKNVLSVYSSIKGSIVNEMTSMPIGHLRHVKKYVSGNDAFDSDVLLRVKVSVEDDIGGWAHENAYLLPMPLSLNMDDCRINLETGHLESENVNAYVLHSVNAILNKHVLISEREHVSIIAGPSKYGHLTVDGVYLYKPESVLC